ncbi:glycosyltransferase family A protein [Klebsiella pneumoniae]|uniref:glycosyltransferase family A protein n=1 Tax=Klebsiella pneumoniae TaxID=573 RepID=UPI0007CA3407|nr:glycosyltransferase family A protein [Klebsiella pneumoniae]MCP5862380.1 glycosyltransferase family 2 protein [Klebsiella pneumoniae]MEC6577522.1 glycosyltransferase family A protein [Klebsiella pneumoniae]SAR78094.1 Glycosyl transferase family 2 [Klebsiella pneumoniae]HBQ7726649.1 glycosyltransferase family 2 protein [Klebsiella pneumoniae]HBY2316806.1 glycosyltransferase family 2 protein [Klebsiella pneumoniae]
MISVNITTTSNRTSLCAATIYSFYNQSIRPDIINLWISKEPYLSDDGFTEVPKFVEELNMICNLIKVHFVKNTGPYRKILPALKEASDDDVLVYADDDVIYSFKWLEELYNEFIKHNREYVVASRVRMMKRNFTGNYCSYSMFPVITENIIMNNDFLITGVGGAVLMKKHIRDEYLTNEDYLEIAPKTDDVWISKILQLSHSSVVTCPRGLSCIMEITHNTDALSYYNNQLRYNSGLLTKISRKLKAFFYRKLGLSLTNNDLSIKKVNKFFKSSL